jgi:hypothetical protein
MEFRVFLKKVGSELYCTRLSAAREGVVLTAGPYSSVLRLEQVQLLPPRHQTPSETR